MSLILNRLETARFGHRCARFDGQAAEFANLSALDAQARSDGIEMISTRLDVAALDRVHALEAAGYRLMDTLVYYAGPFGARRPVLPPIPGLLIREATPDDAAAVAAIAARAFSGYFGHYHADPRLENAAADAAYVEWAHTSIARPGPGEIAFVIEEAGILLGFLTLAPPRSGEIEGVLNAVDPDHQGRGLYSRLLETALSWPEVSEGTRFLISTQINNYPVQQVWSRMGLIHVRSLYTFHKWMND